jgi:hypothetical protein
MSTLLVGRPAAQHDRIQTDDIRRALMADDSPFGLQGLMRDTLTILKPDYIGRLAAMLAICGRPEQSRDPEFVQQILARHPEWQHEYQVVHLIERSLWFAGQSDLVMQLTRNPSRLPDNPPPSILAAMSQAIAQHPQSTVWYGVPLFGEQVNADGLPIPLTAAEVRAEAANRIATAQQHALRWGWLHRAAYRASCVPSAVVQDCKTTIRRWNQALEKCRKYWRRAQRDARLRNRARIVATSEYCRMGESFTRIPAHTTSLGLISEQTAISIRAAHEAVFSRLPSGETLAPLVAGGVPLAIHGVMWTSVAPVLTTSMTIVACDPFLFIELPDEPGKLRFLGHWYWQGETHGRQKLHLHV